MFHLCAHVPFLKNFGVYSTQATIVTCTNHFISSPSSNNPSLAPDPSSTPTIPLSTKPMAPPTLDPSTSHTIPVQPTPHTSAHVSAPPAPSLSMIQGRWMLLENRSFYFLISARHPLHAALTILASPMELTCYSVAIKTSKW